MELAEVLANHSARTGIYMVVGVVGAERKEGAADQVVVVAELDHYSQAHSPEAVDHMERQVEDALAKDVLVGGVLVERAAAQQYQDHLTSCYLPMASDARGPWK